MISQFFFHKVGFFLLNFLDQQFINLAKLFAKGPSSGDCGMRTSTICSMCKLFVIIIITYTYNCVME